MKEVVLLNRYWQSLLKKQQHIQLKDEGRVVNLEFIRTMSSDDVKKSIRAGFKISIINLTFLEVKNGRLLVSSNQQPTGNNVIDKRGALYICESCDEVHT